MFGLKKILCVGASVAHVAVLAAADFPVEIVQPSERVSHPGVKVVEHVVLRRSFARPDELPLIRQGVESAVSSGGHDVWSVLPAFVDGKGSLRMPTVAELRAMAWTSVVCGARGIVFRAGPDDAAVREVACELRSYAADLNAANAGAQPRLEMLSGANHDAAGGPGVLCLLKETGLMIAVNLTSQDVTVRYSLPSGETFKNHLDRNEVLLHRADAPSGPVRAIRAITPRRWDGGVDSEQYKRHLNLVGQARAGGAKVVFVGDSDVWGWSMRGGMGNDGVWRGGGDFIRRKHFGDGDTRMLNLGGEEDCTENILWRLDNGELDGYEADVFVVMAGGENTRRRSAAEEPLVDTLLGVRAILKKIHARHPKAKIVLHPILPTGWDADDPNRVRNARVNRELLKYADDKVIWWCDFTGQLLTADGRVLPGIMPDGQHPGEYAYTVWASAVLPYVTAALNGERMPPSRYAASVDPRAFQHDGSRAVYPSSCINSGMLHFDQKGYKSDWWARRLERNRSLALGWGGQVDVVFIGDSITENWESVGRKQWDALAKEYRVLNLGYGGDRTCEVIWRLESGELDGYQAKVFVVMIGTNNHGLDLESGAASGVRRILDLIAGKHPNAKTILIPIFPRDEHVRCACRAKNEKINAEIRAFADGDKVIWLDFSGRFFDADGDVKWLAKDRLHPGPQGYDFWVEALEPYLRRYAK